MPRSSCRGGPAGRRHPVPCGGDVVHFQHGFHPGGRRAARSSRHRRQDRADPHRAAAQCDMVGLVAAVGGELEAEYPLVDRPYVEVGREDL